jgi:Gram-negative bacterial TonB protein C-terminal
MLWSQTKEVASRVISVLVLLAIVALAVFRSKTALQTRVAPHSEPAATPIGRPASCAVTLPPKTHFTPPPPYPREPGSNASFWFGTQNFWTMLPANGTWRWVPKQQELFLWEAQYDPTIEKTLPLRITGKRLDGLPSQLRSDGESDHGFRDDVKSFMVEGIDLPATGCWEITAHYKNQNLKFVVWVYGPAILKTVLPSPLLQTPRPPGTAVPRIHIDGSLAATALIGGPTPLPVTIANTHLPGTVVLHAVIAKTGRVEEFAPIDGPLSLWHTAMEAVRHWAYRPTIIDGQPVEVATTIDVVFP